MHWTPQLVNKFWDGVAKTELDNLSFGKVAGPKFIELISDFLVPDGRYLDFGAGSGHVLQLLLDQGLNVAGFDPSPDRQALLVEKIGKHENFLGIKGVDSSEQFDVVLLMEVVEHILGEDFHTVLERIARFVKPGGYLVASTPNNENIELSSVYCPISDTFFHPWQHIRSFTPNQLADCFKNMGFSAQFIALVDFSLDADLIENCKKQALGELLREPLLKELNQIDAILQSGATLGLWQKIKRRINLLIRHRTLIKDLHLLAHNLSHTFNEPSNGALRQQRTQREPLADGVDNPKGQSCGIDLRLGRETTIVYIGKKQ